VPRATCSPKDKSHAAIETVSLFTQTRKDFVSRLKTLGGAFGIAEP
jgi:hypothetical protein